MKTLSILMLAVLLPMLGICAQENESLSSTQKSISEEITEKKFARLLVKTNILADVLTIANLGAELSINDKYSVDLPVYYSPYNISNTMKARVFIVQPEVKYWFKGSPFEGHYLGANISTGWYNVALNKKARYQDNKMLMGLGLTYGYYLNLLQSNYIAGFHIGAGYNHYSYDKFKNSDKKEKLGTGKKNYYGITQIGITLAYRIKLK